MHRINYMKSHVLEHVYRAHRPMLKHHGESGYILICMNPISFDKHELVALVKPVGLPAEPHICNTERTAFSSTCCPLEGLTYCVTIDPLPAKMTEAIQRPLKKVLV